MGTSNVMIGVENTIKTRKYQIMKHDNSGSSNRGYSHYKGFRMMRLFLTSVTKRDFGSKG